MTKLLIAFATTVALVGPAAARGPESRAVGDYCYERHGHGDYRTPTPEVMDCIDGYWDRSNRESVELSCIGNTP